MAHLAAIVTRRTFLPTPSPALRLTSSWKPGTSPHQTLARSYSRKTKTKIQIETSELERDIQQLEKAIAEQERKMAAKRAYEESIREYKQRSEAAQSVYKSLSAPVAAPAAKPIPGSNPNALSFLPETFLQDLKLTFLDTRGAREETIKQLQSGLPSTEDLHAATQSGSPAEQVMDNNSSSSPAMLSGNAANEADTNATAIQRVQSLGVDEWNKVIYVNALEGNANNAEQVMKLMEEVGVQPNMESFDHLMEAYVNGGNLKKAQGTIEMILKNGLVPSMGAYNSLMRIHVKSRDISSAFQVFEALKKHHNPDVDVFTNLVKGCLRAQEYDLGWKIFDQMQRSGATPVESTYALMIHACAKTDQVEKALDIFKTYPTRKLQPTDATFNSLIHACAMRPDYFATAFALLNEMQNVYGFEPDVQTYNTLLFACSKRQDLLTARRVFQKVVQLDSEGVLKLDGITVTNFLWCITEWKDMDVHLRNFKLSRRNQAGQIQLEPTPSQLPPSEPKSTELSVATAYFLLPERPPANEKEALAEGESVFSWFVSRTQKAHTEYLESKALEVGEQQADDLQKQEKRVHSRLLNAYLAMYVRHNEMDKATEIYRELFDQSGTHRDSWTYSTMLEGCYHWKDVDLGAEVFRDWRTWRKSTGVLTEKRTRKADYQCYRRMINLLGRTDHLDEAIALLEELSIAATPKNTRLLSEIASTSEPAPTPTPAFTSTASTSFPASSASPVSFSSSALSTTPGLIANSNEVSPSLSFLAPIKEEAVLPIYPKLKDFPVVYTKTWELEDDGARKLLLRLCQGNVGSLYGSSSSSSVKDEHEESNSDSLLPDYQDKRQARYQKAVRNTAIKWKGEHPQEKGFFVGGQRIRELARDVSKRGQDQKRRR
ncbi:hypothetical protein BGZ70_007354 [Mortierella alpina]|uniref:PROP1-like PPR domain-containing protein n=1 Tax=Mortierella alpina TaxID=64518 RepID=A0A9P6JDW8_MORAP|nr:hypothetical protein BGZ70_007354 [Mortierella alpina]